MKVETIYSLLKRSFKYTLDHSIAKHDKSYRRNSVVCLNKLDTHLQLIAPKEYTCMKEDYDSLLDFLNSKEQKEKCTEWVYEIMTTSIYNSDPRRLRNQFLSLESYQPFNTLLIVIYKREHVTINTGGSLSEEIMLFYQTKRMQASDTYNAKESIKNRVNEIIQQTFPQFNLRVEIIR